MHAYDVKQGIGEVERSGEVENVQTPSLFIQAEAGIRYHAWSRALGDVYKKEATPDPPVHGTSWGRAAIVSAGKSDRYSDPSAVRNKLGRCGNSRYRKVRPVLLARRSTEPVGAVRQ